jgi:hypothetical protein
MQGKEKRPLPLHPIPSANRGSNRRRKCQACVRSKMSGISPAAHHPPVPGFSPRPVIHLADVRRFGEAQVREMLGRTDRTDDCSTECGALSGSQHPAPEGQRLSTPTMATCNVSPIQSNERWPAKRKCDESKRHSKKAQYISNAPHCNHSIAFQ